MEAPDAPMVLVRNPTPAPPDTLPPALPLPHEILLQIFGYLSPKELASATLSWKQLADDDSLWIDLLSEVPEEARSPGKLSRPSVCTAKWYYQVKTRQFKTGLPAGKARGFVDGHNSCYEGEVQNGQWHGYGAITWRDGDYYQGEFSMGMLHGSGFRRFPSGDQYEGYWERNVRKNGTVLYSNGNRYEGGWANGLFHGHGIFTWKNGDAFEGEFVNGCRSGEGRVVLRTGQAFEGVMKEETSLALSQDTSAQPPYPGSA